MKWGTERMDKVAMMKMGNVRPRDYWLGLRHIHLVVMARRTSLGKEPLPNINRKREEAAD